MILKRSMELARGRGDQTMVVYYKNTPGGVLWFTDFYKKDVFFANTIKKEWLKQGYYCLLMLDLTDPDETFNEEYVASIIPIRDWE